MDRTTRQALETITDDLTTTYINTKQRVLAAIRAGVPATQIVNLAVAKVNVSEGRDPAPNFIVRGVMGKIADALAKEARRR